VPDAVPPLELVREDFGSAQFSKISAAGSGLVSLPLTGDWWKCLHGGRFHQPKTGKHLFDFIER
jgi:hypothetical protein